MSTSHARIVKPLLKWAGSKRQLLPQLRRFYPKTFESYIEPFFGGGSVFFDLSSSGRLEGRRVVLIDSNADLVGCYETVRDQPERVADALAALADARLAGARAHYYQVRDDQFNPQREASRSPDGRITYTPSLAAMFIYLNRTGFNGLFRVNASGAFNVPAGRYERPTIVDRVRIREVAAALGRPNVQLLFGSFSLAASLATGGDFLYVDPPYAPLSPTASFTSYTAGRFGSEEQAALQRMLVRLAKRRCLVLLSNSTAPEIQSLYERDRQATRAGLRAYRVPARRAINSDPRRRGHVEEYIISNIPRARARG